MSFDFEHAVQAPFRMQPGLRRLAPGATQLSPLATGARHLREKIAVLQHWPEDALVQVAGFDATPALDALAAQAALEHPQAWRVDADGTWHARLLGCAVAPDGGLHTSSQAWPETARCLQTLPAAWRRAGLLALAFAEDFAIVDGDRATLPWLAVCLPSHWAPTDKIGRHFAEVHAPVADNALLVKAGEHLMRLVSGTERWERFVWNVTGHARLHTHPLRVDPQPWPAALSPETWTTQAWWRTERQTFLPLPERRQAVFTIRVDVQALSAALVTPAQAQRLHDSIASMSAAVLDYRHLTPVRDALLAWLTQRSRPSA